MELSCILYPPLYKRAALSIPQPKSTVVVGEGGVRTVCTALILRPIRPDPSGAWGFIGFGVCMYSERIRLTPPHCAFEAWILDTDVVLRSIGYPLVLSRWWLRSCRIFHINNILLRQQHHNFQHALRHPTLLSNVEFRQM